MMSFKATYLGSNGWILDFNKCRLLIDPWLEGDLVFPPGEWFFKGSLENDIPVPKNIDLILITQGLPDHCHIKTLLKFSKEIDIVCPKSAFNLLSKNGFSSIKLISPQEIVNLKGLRIEATSGAKVPHTENGYIVEGYEGSFYIEPHGFFDKNIKERKLDAVITPTKDLGLPFVGNFIKGNDVLPKLIKSFKPNYVLSSTTGGDVKFSGILNKFIKIKDNEKILGSKLKELKTMESINL